VVRPTHSAIYECEVMHHRLTPKKHHFRYRVFYLWLDLDEVEGLSEKLRLFSHNARNVFSFFDGDHLDESAGSIKSRILHWIATQGQDTSSIASVRMLTFPRVFGYIFNPVCFYFCYDADGGVMCSVVQVTNTFHEQKPYLLNQARQGGGFRLITPKHFYVSPFTTLDLCFDFQLRVPADKLEIRIDDREGDKRVLLTMLTGNRKQLTDARLLWFVFKYPLLTLRVIFLIHWHAWLLWLKQTPFHRKAANPDLQRDLLRPHGPNESKNPL